MVYRAAFLQGLELLAEAVEEMAARGLPRPVLVGGAAVELWTGSAVVSGDFDLVTEDRATLEEILIAKGFRRPTGEGALLRGLYHPDLGFGVEVVSGPLFDGAVPEERVVLLELTRGKISVVSPEDIIADRMGQYACNEVSMEAMLDQAIQVYRLASDMDLAYLDERIRRETMGTYGLSDLLARMARHENDKA